MSLGRLVDTLEVGDRRRDARIRNPSGGVRVRAASRSIEATTDRTGATMRHLLLLTSAALLGATSALGTADLPSRATVDLVSLRAADVAAPGTADLSMFEAAHLPAAASSDADRPTCMGQPVSPGGVGTSGDDVIVGTRRKDVIVAGAGNDVVRGRDGRDVICGGPGEDTLVGGRNPADWSTRQAR